MDEQLYEELSDLVVRKDKFGLMKRLEELDDSTRAEFARRQRLEKELINPYDPRPRCADGQLGKFCLIEYENVERDFETVTAFIAMSSYLYERLGNLYGNSDEDKYECKIVRKFLDNIFNHRYSKHIDTIYDVYLKSNTKERSEMMKETRDEQLNPAFIPSPKVMKVERFADLAKSLQENGSPFSGTGDSFSETEDTYIHKIVECSAFSAMDAEQYAKLVYGASIDGLAEELEAMDGQEQAFIVKNAETIVPIPSYWQYRNLLNYYNVKLEEHRLMSSIMTGRKPSSELLLHVHGVFSTTDEMETYRIKKSSNIHGKAVVCPVGRTALGDDFRTNKDGIIMYNPADPEIEIMMQGKHNIRRIEAEAVKGRMQNINERSDPATIAKIRKWRQARDKLTKGKAKILKKFANEETVEIDAKVETAVTAIDRKIHDALSMLDDDEVVFETLEVKDGKLTKGEDMVMKVE